MYTRDEKEKYMYDQLKAEGINDNAIDFFMSLMDAFKVTESITSTTDKLAKRYCKSDRTIQRYVKLLKEKRYLHVRPIYNNENPDKSYIEYNIYSLMPKSKELLAKATAYSHRNRNVYFMEGYS